jgi:threonine synthase
MLIEKEINMKFYNIKNKSEVVSLKEAVLQSIVQENGLYMPEYIPRLPDSFFDNLINMSLKEIAYEVSATFFNGEIPNDVLKKIVEETFDFPIPLVRLSEKIFSLELYHGPTLAFKDVGARFMSGIFEYFIGEEKKDVYVLAATSGDTGSAVANAFYNRKGVKVFVLFPKDKISEIQRLQMTTLGTNITAIEVKGDFDDCQALVKKAFADRNLNLKLNLTSANSINIARLFPQCIYYFYAVAQLLKINKKPVFSVPSGNFGNLTAGLIAKKMGLPIKHFIASTNRNNSIPEYLTTGKYHQKPTIYTISNAMDVSNPSNFIRIKELYNNSVHEMNKDIFGSWFTDDETKSGIKELFEKYNYIADPHGAIAFLGLKKFPFKEDQVGVFLETAHPIKFNEIVEEVINQKIEIPDHFRLIKNNVNSLLMENNYYDLMEILLNK